jgi:hypothetical protein
VGWTRLGLSWVGHECVAEFDALVVVNLFG